MLRREIFAFVIAVATSSSIAAEVTTFSDREVVPGTYAVFFQDEATSIDRAKQVIAGIARKGYVRVDQTWDGNVNGVLISNVDEATAKEIAATPGVESVTQDYVVEPSTLQFSAPIQIDRIDQAQLPLSGYYSYINTGAGVHAYVIDSTILTTHEDFQLNGVSRASNDVLLCQSDSQCTGQPYYHGTVVASVLGGKVSGVAKEVRIHGVNVGNNAGHSTAAIILSGIQWVQLHGLHPGVVNLSWNTRYSASDPISVNISAATANLIASNFFVSASAGNGGIIDDSCSYAIQRTPGVFVVAGIDQNDQSQTAGTAGGTSVGPCVTAYAEFNVYAATSSSNSAYISAGGTSFASPVAAGIAALYWSKAPTTSRSAVMSGIIGQTTFGVIGGVPPNTPNKLLRVWPGL